MRLIDADKFKEKIFSDSCQLPTTLCCIIRDLIDEQPTTYDVDKVVEELHRNSCDYESPCKSNKVKCKACEHYVIGCKEAIEIVRKGGVNDGK